MTKEKTDGIVMALLDSPLSRCSFGFAADGVDIGALVDEKLAECVVIVYGSPLEHLSTLAWRYGMS